MPTQYDNWKLDNGIDDAAELRDEWIEDRAEELVRQRIRDADAVNEVIATLVQGDDTDWIASELATFIVSMEYANECLSFAAAAIGLQKSLRSSVERAIKDTALADAAIEHDALGREQT